MNLSMKSAVFSGLMAGSLGVSDSAIMAAEARDFSDVEMSTRHLAGNVYVMEGRGGNIGLSVGADGILMIDDQFEPLAEKIKAELTALGSGPLRYVLNTHYHSDHTGSNAVFGAEAPIFAHHNVRKRLSMPGVVRGREVPAKTEDYWPVITFGGDLTFHFNGEEVRGIHYPKGHTDGDVIVFFSSSNVVHTGDVFWSGMLPFVDLDAGGSVSGMLSAVDAVLAEIDSETLLIPGHGPVSTRKDLEEYHLMLTETIGFVQAAIDRAVDLESAKAEGLPERWKTWETEFIPQGRWIETIYESLAIEAGR